MDINISTHMVGNMKLRKAVDGSHFIVVNADLVRANAWEEGDEMALLAVSSDLVIPKASDYLLRRVGNGK